MTIGVSQPCPGASNGLYQHSWTPAKPQHPFVSTFYPFCNSSVFFSLNLLTHWPLRDVAVILIYTFQTHSRIVAWALTAKLLSDECRRTSVMRSTLVQVMAWCCQGMANVDQFLGCHMASPCQNELTEGGIMTSSKTLDNICPEMVRKFQCLSALQLLFSQPTGTQHHTDCLQRQQDPNS